MMVKQTNEGLVLLSFPPGLADNQSSTRTVMLANFVILSDKALIWHIKRFTLSAQCACGNNMVKEQAYD